MNIFVDYHHGDLLYSFQLLFEKRLGHNLFRPIGMDWFYAGLWNIGDPYPNPEDTAKQYLGIDDRTWDAYTNLNGDYHIQDGIYHVYDPVHGGHQKAITLEAFKEMDIDIIISSYPFGHDQTYRRLRDELKPSAKLVSHMGNIYQHTEIDNILCSTAPFPTEKNVVFYHQEFDLNIYKPVRLQPIFISNFVNVQPRKDLFDAIAPLVPEYQFKSFGAGNKDGTITQAANIATLMNSSKFGWHVKPGGDGFGHVIHNWYACGKPVITSISDYRDKLAGLLLTDSITCIDVDGKSPEEIAERIRHFSQPEEYQAMCLNARSRFEDVVNYEKESHDIMRWLQQLS